MNIKFVGVLITQVHICVYAPVNCPSIMAWVRVKLISNSNKGKLSVSYGVLKMVTSLLDGEYGLVLHVL